ncbi:uncharacterized protein N7496_003288 [Penicillium cataractarum]|uniref:Uncharacterized protein n=1 Tax=Penicillium cataractarum TaxID=2100454 RepID=A0A9W9VIP1_9EURO|nr:uncharacterized protein N7496_003288 [Penicillium cataractarum]KAJ5380860.1 hypothetical protein N7496_003288 [Penicillium cataractarum]
MVKRNITIAIILIILFILISFGVLIAYAMKHELGPFGQKRVSDEESDGGG